MKIKQPLITSALLGLSATLSQAALITHLDLDATTGLTANGGAAITAGSGGLFDEAATFDGTDDFFYVTDSATGTNPGISGTGARTFAAWVYADVVTGGSNVPVSTGLNSGFGTKFDVDIQDANLEVGIGQGRSATTATVGTGAWTFVVVTVGAGETAGDILSYVNGTKFTSGAHTQTVGTNGTSLRIGSNAPDSDPTSAGTAYFDGLVDDVSIWDEQLTDDEIIAFYDVGADLAYTADLFEDLKDVHDAGSGSVVVNAVTWGYATGLTGVAGLDVAQTTLVLDATADTGLVVVPAGPAATLFTSDFDGHDVAVDGSYVKDVTGQAVASVSWTTDASVTAISDLTAITGGGAWVNQNSGLSTGDTLKVNYNMSNATNQGFSMTFTVSASADLSNLSVVNAQSTGTGAEQLYTSDLNFELSGGTLGSPVTGTTNVDYNSPSGGFRATDFDLTGTTIGAGAYTLQVYMDNLSTGGAYATFDGITLEAVAAAPSSTFSIGTTPSGGFIENFAGASGSNTRVTTGNSKGQSFTLTGDTDMTGFSLDVNTVTTLSDLTVEIFAATGDLPTGSALFSFAGTIPAGLTPSDWLECTFASTLELTAGDYVLLLSTTASDLRFELNASDDYSSGRLVRDTGSGWETANAGDDFIFSFAGTMDPPSGRTPSTGPNIVFIMVDDLGWVDHSASNMAGGIANQSDFIQTPHMARLANEGVSFTSTYAQPNCAPSRGVFYTGQYSCRTANGVYNVASLDRDGGRTTYTDPANQGDALIQDSVDATLIAEALYDAGYVTAHFGKFHIGTDPLTQGYEYNYGGGNTGDPSNFFASGTPREFAGPVGVELDPFAADYTQAYIDDNLDAVANGNNPDTLLNTPKHLTDAMGDAFESFMDAHRSGPMSNFPVYVQFNMYAPHTPIQPRPDLQTKYNGLPAGTKHSNAAYAGLVEGMDQTLGRVLNYLDDPNGDGNLSDSMVSNTLVIFTSDNGGVIGITSNAPLRGHKGMHYEGGLRVPMVVRMPGTVPANKVTDTMVHFTDFYPTLLDAADSVPYPSAALHPLDGETFWAHALDPDSVSRNRSPIFYHFPGYMDNRTYNSSTVIAELNGERYKYIYNYDPYYDALNGEIWGADQYQLYNLTNDISEDTNLLDYIDIENAGGPNDPSTTNEYWDYILNVETADQLAVLLNGWLVGDPSDTSSTWNPIYTTYNANYPNLDPLLIGTETGPAPAVIPVVEVPLNQAFRVEDQSFPNTSTFRVRFTSEPNYTFQVQKRTSLTAGDWVDEGSPVVATGTTTEIDVAVNTATTPDCFFRVTVSAQ